MPRSSVRVRMTVLYSVLFLIASGILMTLNYVLVRHQELKAGHGEAIFCRTVGGASVGLIGNATFPTGTTPLPAGCSRVPASSLPPPPDVAQATLARQVVTATQNDALHVLETESGIALAVMAIVSVGLGWLMAGRVLRPVHRITDTARRLSRDTLDERIRLQGPDDELKDLADTFDAMLDRLERSFDSQKRFVANASHELLTPLATERVLIDEALADPRISAEELRSILQALRTTGEDSERLVSALLMLARSEQGISRRETTDLATLVAQVVEKIGNAPITTNLAPAPLTGDPVLLERLVGNLVDNALRHNVASGGWVRVSTTSEQDQARLEVSNSGPLVTDGEIGTLFQPFTRQTGARVVDGGGFGLGLSIVAAVVTAHGGQIEASPGPKGGLVVTVRIPARIPVAVG